MPTTSTIDWPALFLEALEDIKANKPLPTAAPMTEDQIKAILAAAQADLPAFVAEFQAYPGVITAAGRFLSALASEGRPWAATVKAVLDGLPGGLAAAEEFAPFVSGMIDEFSPVPGKFLGIA